MPAPHVERQNKRKEKRSVPALRFGRTAAFGKTAEERESVSEESLNMGWREGAQ